MGKRVQYVSQSMDSNDAKIEVPKFRLIFLLTKMEMRCLKKISLGFY